MHYAVGWMFPRLPLWQGFLDMSRSAGGWNLRDCGTCFQWKCLVMGVVCCLLLLVVLFPLLRAGVSDGFVGVHAGAIVAPSF